MARKVFYSFHYKPDNWRAAQVRNSGVIEGNRPVSDNDWEEVTSGGDPAIEAWIRAQMSGKSCAVVLIGSATANRKWINFEIKEAWNAGKGVVGIYIHNLRNSQGLQANKGGNPFDYITVGSRKLSTIAKAYDVLSSDSTVVYETIKKNLEGWVEEAISIRSAN